VSSLELSADNPRVSSARNEAVFGIFGPYYRETPSLLLLPSRVIKRIASFRAMSPTERKNTRPYSRDLKATPFSRVLSEFALTSSYERIR